MPRRIYPALKLLAPVRSPREVQFRPKTLCFLLLSGLCLIDGSQSVPAAEFEAIEAVDVPPHVGVWETKPTVIVCPDTEVSILQVEQAMTYWRKRDFEIGSLLYHEDPQDMCANNTPWGHIVIRFASAQEADQMEAETLAETHFWIDDEHRFIRYAKIILVEHLRKGVLEHEFGHCFGFSHVNRPGHLMNPRHSRAGWDDDGLLSPKGGV